MIIPRPYDVMVRPFYDPGVSPGGIIIPDSAKERSDQGIIKYIGDKVTYVKIGDYVLFSGYSGDNIKLEGEDLLIRLHQRLIIAIIGTKEWSTTLVDGLYYRARNGEYFHATYETAVERLYESREGWTRNIRFGHKSDPNTYKIDHRPAIEELELDTKWDET